MGAATGCITALLSEISWLLPEELSRTTGFEQIHPDDRQKVLEAAAEARRSGVGRSVEYRIRHKDGRWVPLESTASVLEAVVDRSRNS